ncbi:MAG: MBL fold metallo-hydrolase [Acutalibacteraceae bacterium]
MEIKTIRLGHIHTNCYLISSEKAAIVIDPGFKSEVAKEFLFENSDKAAAILLTHAHFDHIGGVAELKAVHEAPVATGANEADIINDPSVNMATKFHARIGEIAVDMPLFDGQTITIGDLEIKVIETPGHTPGGVSYLIGNNLFSGDTLFLESIGRTDFPGGDYKQLENSIRKIYDLPDDTMVYPGHGEPTTVGHEKKFNPYVRY